MTKKQLNINDQKRKVHNILEKWFEGYILRPKHQLVKQKQTASECTILVVVKIGLKRVKFTMAQNVQTGPHICDQVTFNKDATVCQV